ncbi:hypothetical protein VAR608DRAFT_0805 [Variovorax sp. HW608]|uniref:acyl-CoA/acyl-ACP dehydrogenase n=1 Tax=Variovorax sp. HW608 TaxID=1034889 RepID=UPI000820032D|nr:acyl-CoA/acyl-ACP dehydrogenase [Variovorax sp. HW608]SCK13588.1 hypothetical protein VAR608DRAFT_0805 [Variovorax sp. HW608]
MTPSRKALISTAAPVNEKKAVVAAGLEALRLVVESGLLRCAVPESLGGDGGSLGVLSQGATELAERSKAAAWILWAQRTTIEALVHSPNIGLREYLLPQLLEGERAGTLPLTLGERAILAEEAGNAYRLYGHLEHVPNLQWLGFTLLAPIQRPDRSIAWVALRSEEDGLRAGIDHAGDFWWGSRTAPVTLEGAFFRMDEWVNEAELIDAIDPVLKALSLSVGEIGPEAAARARTRSGSASSKAPA